MKNNKGITLVALIITIIVMLILVAVSVAFAVQSGLFDQADKATEDWKDAEKTEAEAEGKVKLEDGTEKDIDTYVSELVSSKSSN